MIRLIRQHRIAFLILALFLLFQSFHSDLHNPYRKPITGDAKGYYAYLPAIFIYHDLGYSFIPQIEKTYYAPGLAKSFVKDVDGGKVNKTFPGVTILYLPFFLLAHGISLVFGLPADGYAYTYQLLFLAGSWVYFLAGMICLKKVLLELGFTARNADLSLLVCTVATNLFFYTVYDASVTHIHNFFMVNLAVLLALQLKKQLTLPKLALFFSLLALIGITRPTNLLVLLAIPFFIPEKTFYRSVLLSLNRFQIVLKVFVFPVVILCIPLILWKLQTGHWLVYSYGEEGFDFAHPEIVNFLFSYTKGWFVYTPVTLLILVPGIILLFRTDRRRAILAILFYVTAIYIFSSWWCWYYGAGMSQRVMIDYIILQAYLAAVIFRALENRRVLRGITVGIAVLLAGLNIAQSYQVARGILPMGSPTRVQYWDNFLVFKKRAKIYPKDHWILVEDRSLPLDPAGGMVEKGIPFFDSEWKTAVSDTNSYSAVIQIPAVDIRSGSKLIFSFEALARMPVIETRFAVICDQNPAYTFFLSDYLETGNWTRMEFMIEPPAAENAVIDLYFWNAGSTEHVEIRNLRLKHYYSGAYF